MEPTGIIRIGILFNAIVCGTVTIAATLLAFFLFNRWHKLSPTMKAYAWFWVMAIFIWLPLSLRYLIVSLGMTEQLLYLALITQIALSMCGPPLIYYLTTHLLQGRFKAWFFSVIFLIIGGIGIWYDMKPDGLIILPLTYFSAEITLNSTSMYLYIGVISVIFLFLFIDIGIHGISYFRYRQEEAGYETLYSLAVAIYLILGSLEVVAFITDWVVVVFRVLYVGTFLVVYLVMKNHEDTFEKYFFEKNAK